MAQALLSQMNYSNRNYPLTTGQTQNYLDQVPVTAYRYNLVVDFVNSLETRLEDIEDGSFSFPEHITDTTQSTSISTGSFVADGGAGIAKNLWVGGTLNIAGVSTFQSANVYKAITGITAFAGGGQASATQLAGEINYVTVCATVGDSVKLGTPALGSFIIVKNAGSTALDIFPPTGATINGYAVNLAVRIQSASTAIFFGSSATAWHTAQGSSSLTLNSPTTVTGQLELKATASAGNTVTTITNASQAAARTYTIPDAGASANFVMSEGAATINGIKTFGSQLLTSAGIVTAPGLVIGANDNGLYEISSSQIGTSIGNTLVGGFDTVGLFTSRISEQVALGAITFVGQEIKSAATSLTALAGGAQAGTALTKTFNEFTTVVTAADSAQLPIAVLGKKVIVRNSAAKAMAVFGQTGDAIDGASANASFTLQPGAEITFEGTSGTTWVTNLGTSLGTISSVTQGTSITTGVTVNSRKGIITTFTPSTAGLAATTFTVTCNKTTATANIRAYVTEYGGTVITNGLPYIFVKNQTATSFDIVIYNAHASNALATSMKIGFEIIN